MKHITFNIGPSQLYPTVVYHIKEALRQGIVSYSHRSEEFEKIFQQTTIALRQLLHIPASHHIVFISSGTEAMERTIQNMAETNTFHFVNGSFSKRWFEIAQELGKSPQKAEVELGKGFIQSIAIPKETELLCFTHNETSTGAMLDTKYIYAVGKENPNMLIAVDAVSSMPWVHLQYAMLDCVFFSVQKLFGLPAGLGVMILSPRAIEKAKQLKEKGINIGTYHSFPTLVEWEMKSQTPETPNMLAIYLLGKVAEDLQKIGIENLRKEIQERADFTYSFLEKLPLYIPFVALPFRSPTTITVNVENPILLAEKLKQKGITVGIGYGPLKGKQIRIANFPAISRKDIEYLLYNL